MTSLLADNALSSLERTRLWVKRSRIKVDNDDELELRINGFSTAFANYTGRQFVPEASASKLFRYEGDGILDLAPFELRSVSAIVTYSDQLAAAQTTLDPGTATTLRQFQLEPRAGTPESTYWWIAMPLVDVAYRSRHMGSQVTVTGTWGMAEVPADVEMALWVEVANSFRNPEGFDSRQLGELSISEVPDLDDLGFGLSRKTRGLLSAYRRISF